jgi:phytanoyl-CoA hydroxylase
VPLDLPFRRPQTAPSAGAKRLTLEPAQSAPYLVAMSGVEARSPIDEDFRMLDQGQIDQFKDSGYTVEPGLLGSAELADLMAAIEAVASGQTLGKHDAERLEMEPDQPAEGTAVRRIYEPCTYYPEFQKLCESPALLDDIAKLLGPDLTYHYSKINMKPAAVGSVVEWHQDLAYYPLTNRDSLAVLLYLDDTDEENGCLQILPGRQHGPLLAHSREEYFQGMVTEQVDAAAAEPVTGPAGTAVFMHCMTPHSSIANRSTRSRRTLILSYRAADSFPIFYGEQAAKVESHTRHVRGNLASVARFSMSEFPIPRFKRRISSLYDLQDSSKRED